MAKEGILFVSLPLVVGIVLLILGIPFLSPVLGGVAIILAGYFAFFFRDPARRIAAEEGEILSPVDGTVLDIIEEDEVRRLVIFLSIFNVHVTRMPLKGTVKKMEYFEGQFLPAYREKASELNERITLDIESAAFGYSLRLIAGVAARRIRMWIEEGSPLGTGEKIGIIMFGSRAELFIPKSVALQVSKGQKVKGGLTSIGKQSNPR